MTLTQQALSLLRNTTTTITPRSASGLYHKTLKVYFHPDVIVNVKGKPKMKFPLDRFTMALEDVVEAQRDPYFHKLAAEAGTPENIASRNI